MISFLSNYPQLPWVACGAATPLGLYVAYRTVPWCGRKISQLVRGACKGIVTEFRAPRTADQLREQAARLELSAEALTEKAQKEQKQTEIKREVEELRKRIQALEGSGSLPLELKRIVENRVQQPPLHIEFPTEEPKKIKESALIKAYQKEIDTNALNKAGMVKDSWDAAAQSKIQQRIRKSMKDRKIKKKYIDQVIQKLNFRR
ncbi:MAG: hypothetical protein KGR16_06870 [Verrucomicrobia bacterium]|nr:hypothetical protein [Verrucomicrobiota bacterium]MDE3048058.1 hypothetical protein [Verrucomicrobiota bacterium]